MVTASPFRATFFALSILLSPFALECWAPEKWFEAPKSNRAVHYKITAVLNWQKKQLEGRLNATWRNVGSSPTQEMPFQAHLNAFRNQDAINQRAGGQKITKVGPNSFGHCEIKSITCNGTELPVCEGEDDTVFWVSLPKPVLPGQSVAVEISWEAKFPEIQSGIGWTGRYLVASAWYPKLGYYAGNQWVCPPFQPNAMPHGHFGSYDVELSLPNALQLANTGTVLTPMDESGKPMTDKRGRIVEATFDPEQKLHFIYKIHAEDVQDFAWAATAKGGWRLERHDFGDTQVFFYSIPRNGSQLRRLKNAAWSAMRFAEISIGPYPYPVLSIVDLPKAATENGANSSPTFTMLSSVAFDPLYQRFVPEQAVIQQIAEQYFKWAVAADAPGGSMNCLSSQIANWFTSKVIEQEYLGLLKSKRFRINSPSSSLYLRQTEASLGTVAMENVMRVYFAETSFRHAEQSYFHGVAKKVSGQGLGAFWEDCFEKAATLDCRIKNVSKTPEGNGIIELVQKGDIAAPIALWVCLENGQEITQIWDGNNGQATFTFDYPITAAALDADWEHTGLENRLHSTYVAKPKRRGLQYWAGNFFAAVCGFLQGMGIG